jgi:electron transfer flavoprotein beta subunit
MVPGMIPQFCSNNLVNSCTVSIEGTAVKAVREIDGKETPTITINCRWSKGLVEEKDLRIPNMRGIMTARSKALTIVEPS